MTAHRLVAIFLLGAALFGWPLLAVVERLASGRDAPWVFLYLLGAWATLVVLVACAVRRRR